MLFSVIVANYNNGQYLPDLITSVLNQTYSNWELIIVDDCSNENPLKYINSYLTDIRIKFLSHKINLGAGATFKTAATHATGDIIGMLGADDALVPTALATMVKAHEQFPDASMINSECYWCDEHLHILHKYEHYTALEPGQSLIRNLTVGSFATFKRAAYLKTAGFDPAFKRAVDHDIYLKLDEVGSLEYVHQPLYLYRKNLIGISQNDNGMKAAQFSNIAKYNAYKRRLGTVKDNLSRKEISCLIKNWYMREIYQARITGNKQTCNSIIKRAVKEIPSILLNKTFIMSIIRNNMFSK